MSDHNALTLVIFIVTYAVIALGEVPYFRIDRTGAALAGAVAMIISGALSEQAAERAIDAHMLALLLGMMIVVANLRLSGAFAMSEMASEVIRPCLKNRRSKGLANTGARESRPQRRRENSSAKNWSISARASMAHA